MRKIREALRLRASGLTTRDVGESVGVGRTSVSEYLKRAAGQAGLSWPLPDDGHMMAIRRSFISKRTIHKLRGKRL